MLSVFIENVRFGVTGDIVNYNFRLSSLVYKGKKNGRIFDDKTHHYTLLFKLYEIGYEECADPYGNYEIEMDNLLILGLKREQV